MGERAAGTGEEGAVMHSFLVMGMTSFLFFLNPFRQRGFFFFLPPSFIDCKRFIFRITKNKSPPLSFYRTYFYSLRFFLFLFLFLFGCVLGATAGGGSLFFFCFFFFREGERMGRVCS